MQYKSIFLLINLSAQFRELKQRQDETIYEFYIRLKEQGQKCGFIDHS